MPIMAERIRLTFDIPERVRRALNIRAARKGVSVGEVIEQLVEELCADDLDLADKSISEGEESPRPKRKKE